MQWFGIIGCFFGFLADVFRFPCPPNGFMTSMEGPQTSAPLGWWESMTTRHGLVSNWSHFFQEVPLAWWDFPELFWGCLKRLRIYWYWSDFLLGFKNPGDDLCLFFFQDSRCFKRFLRKKRACFMESMRCFYQDLCMWHICRSCLIHTRDSAWSWSLSPLATSYLEDSAGLGFSGIRGFSRSNKKTETANLEYMINMTNIYIRIYIYIYMCIICMCNWLFLTIPGMILLRCWYG